MENLKYLETLGVLYPDIASATSEIVNLRAILALPKGTEHFITDLHGEYEQFCHIMANGSGAVTRKIDDCFGRELSQSDKKHLANLIYSPELKLNQFRQQIEDPDELEDWYQVMILRLIRVCKNASSKYTRSKVRKALPKSFAYVLEELLAGRPDISDQEAYYQEIISSVIHVHRAEELICDLCYLIRRFTIDHLHILGDIYDRGPFPHLIMEKLLQHHSLDIQWGNHDVLWMGAAMGNPACVANVIRICARYGNMAILEDGYGINMIPLVRFAQETYPALTGEAFKVHVNGDDYDESYAMLDARMQKAIAVIQFKLEGELIRRHPEWDMEDRLLLDGMDLTQKTVVIGKEIYPLNDCDFPTIDPNNPYHLTTKEEELIRRLCNSFQKSEALNRHVRFLFTKGGLYKVYNGNLLFHGCMPTNKDGSFMEVEIEGIRYKGKPLYDILERLARRGFHSKEEKERILGGEILWFLWECKYSPLFGKDKMATFERYFVDDPATHIEKKNPYYHYYENEAYIDRLLHEFGLSEQGHVINGHMPVAVVKGESPVKCSGKVLVIDGGFSRAYQKKTGIAGYTLTYNSYGLILSAHEPFSSMEDAVLNENENMSQIVMEESVTRRKTVADTDTGDMLREKIEGLEELVKAYRKGLIIEKN